MDTQGEFDWIERIEQEAGPPPRDAALGIGDDCALLRCGPQLLAVTKDVMTEDVHFRRRWMSPYFLGRKSLAVNLSDLAAMGARPHSCLLGLSLPADRRSDAESFLSGFLEETRRWGCPLIGGDLSGCRTVHVSVTALGFVPSPPAALRSAARAGDLVLLVGDLGLARTGLEMVENIDCKGLENLRSPQELAGWTGGGFPLSCLTALLCPEPQVKAGEWLREHGLVNAMIDVSDGLGADLLHVARRSGLAAVLEVDRLTPLQRRGERTLSLEAILNGGEDYALLFTASPLQWNRLRNEYPPGLPAPRRIGTMKKGAPGLFLKGDSGLRECEPRGFDHFR